MRITWFHIIVFVSLIGITSHIASGEQTKKPFTVADGIGLTYFGGPEGMDVLDTWRGAGMVQFSPDGTYFAVHTERGRLDLNRVEDALRFYRRRDVEDFLKHSDMSQPPSPVWVVNRSDKVGPVINDWRWLPDSSGVAFLDGGGDFGPKRLVLADLRKKIVEILTSALETVGAFDVRDRRHYVYTTADPAAERAKIQAERQSPAIVGTGRSLFELLFPDHRLTVSAFSHRSHLWAVADGKRFEVKHDGAPLAPEDISGAGVYLALSPNGRSLVTTLTVPQAPASWETLYSPPYASSPYHIFAGQPISQYVRIDLQNGMVQDLTGAPTARAGGWWWVFGLLGASWSRDGKTILLPGTFISSKDSMPSQPCIAVVDLPSDTRTCVEVFKGSTPTTVPQSVLGARFVGGDKQRVVVIFSSGESTEYRRTDEGTWEVTKQLKSMPEVRYGEFGVNVKQAFNESPQLVATDSQTSRVLWDPNPQVKDIELGQTKVYTWNDKDGRDRKGGLYLPSDYKPGQRYPLVVQTHGFRESQFSPSGIYPTAFAARAPAAAGIVVLQVRDDQYCSVGTPEEGPCAVSSYETAIPQLVSQGLVDADKIGIVGFSCTCYYVIEALTTSSLHFKAASITDGFMPTYSQYMLTQSLGHGDVGQAFDSVVGARPFREGLQQWLKRSPGFNLDKVTTPLLVVGEGGPSVLDMWEPYAGLRYLHKPVDFVMLNTEEHVLTNPGLRMASQGGTVDWFRFWLKGEEDPDPAKVEQYIRWHELRKLREEEENKSATP